ncbi:hypothetical protein [Agromyces soli]|uniref:Uncharacterized protein n=1 Tax=Agromyces soli TaxID=659012 RepID=A0ABY4AY81_9MICO|nr:hypothetical protein [Agromyces soli]UOE27814.1 hypothetical protein MTP13_08560 [Agromyces soli]
MTTTPVNTWAPPSNRPATTARKLAPWTIAVAAVFWLVPIVLTFVPSPTVQTIGLIVVWIGFLPYLGLTVTTIVFAAKGLASAGRLGGLGRSDARFALVATIVMFVAAPVAAVVLAVLASLLFS